MKVLIISFLDIRHFQTNFLLKQIANANNKLSNKYKWSTRAQVSLKFSTLKII